MSHPLQSSNLPNCSQSEVPLGKDPCVYIVVVGGLSFSDDGTHQWLDSAGAFWPKQRLYRDFPKARVLHVHKPSEPAESPWRTIDRRAANLVETLDAISGHIPVPLLFLCQGLGGLVALKALKLSESGSWKHKIGDATKGIVFFGTPLNYSKRKLFQSAVRACATVELLSQSKAENPSEDDIDGYIRLIEQLERRKLPVLSVFECGRCQDRGTAAPWPQRRSRVIVNEDIAQLKGARLLSSSENHHNVTDCNAQNYADISSLVCTVASTPARVDESSTRSKVFGSSTSLAHVKIREQRGSIPRESANQPINSLTQSPNINASSRPPNLVFGSACRYIDFPENQYFVGRRGVLDIIKKHLIDDHDNNPSNTCPSTVSRAFALWAPKGFGKTQIARQFALEANVKFSYVLWVFADAESKISDAYATYALLLGLVKDSTDFVAASKALMNWFAAVDMSWLVIFDNAVDPNLINIWWPRGKSGSVLITTLDPTFATSNVAGYGMELKKLDEKDAIDMVLSQIPAHSLSGANDSQEARKIVQRVAHLPLAIQHCVGTINDSNRSLSHYNRRYSDSNAVLRASSVDKVNRNFAPYPQGLTEALQDRLSTLDEHSRALMDVFALLDPDRIPEKLIDPIEPLEDLSDIGFIKNLDGCVTRLSKGLVARGGCESARQEIPIDNFHMHSLMRDFLQMVMTDGTRQISFDTATRLLSMAIDKKTYPSNQAEMRSIDRRYFLEYFTHIESVRAFYEATWQRHGLHVLEIPLFFLMLLGRSSWLCYTAGFFNDGLAHVRTGERILENLEKDKVALKKVPEPDCLTQANLGLYHAHASIATEIGDFSLSLEKFQKQKSVFDEAVKNGYQHSKGNKKRLKLILGGIANSYQGLGNQVEAEAYYKECLKLGERNDIHSSYEVNICRSLWARGANNEASSRLENLIALREAEHGPDDIRDFVSGHMRYVLGNVRIAQGRYDEAYVLHESALKIWRKTFGENHHKTGDAWYKYGWHLARLKEFDKARNALTTAVSVYHSGTDERFRRGEIARSNYKLSLVLHELNLIKDSRKALQKAETIRATIKSQEDSMSLEPDDAVYDSLVSLWSR